MLCIVMYSVCIYIHIISYYIILWSISKTFCQLNSVYSWVLLPYVAVFAQGPAISCVEIGAASLQDQNSKTQGIEKDQSKS